MESSWKTIPILLKPEWIWAEIALENESSIYEPIENIRQWTETQERGIGKSQIKIDGG